jgi:hypothetical protein
MALWRELAEQFLPFAARFTTGESQGRGAVKRNDKIINSAPVRATSVCRSGLVAGVTSPARPWSRLRREGYQSGVEEGHESKTWMRKVDETMRDLFSGSNVYTALNELYDFCVFGTSCVYVGEDLKDGIRCTNYPLGSYCLDQDKTQRIDTVYREFTMSTAQMVEMFGLSACSSAVQEQYKANKLSEQHTVLFAVEPNRDLVRGRLDRSGMPWRSVWLQLDGGDGILREGGYHEFPFLVARWGVTGEDVYASQCPGIDALGDAKQLQKLERDKLQAFTLAVRPPMVGPSSMRQVSLLPGSVTYNDSPTSRFEAAVRIDPSVLQAFANEIAIVTRRIDELFYVTLWLMISGDSRSQPATAEEIRAKQEEKMLQLGPTQDKLQAEVVEQLVDRAFGIMARGGMLPPQPDELRGQKLAVQHTSLLAQARKLLETAPIERFASFGQVAAQTDNTILDRIDGDKMLRAYGEALSIAPDLMRSDDEVAAIRDGRQQQQQAQAQGEAMLAATQGAKNLAQSPMDQDNALNRTLGALGPGALTAGTGVGEVGPLGGV